VTIATSVPQPKIAQPAIAETPVPTVREAQEATPVAEPRPAAAEGTAQVPSVRVATATTAHRVAVAAPQAVQAPRPVAAAATPHAAAAPHAGHVIKEDDDGFHPVKWICIIVGVLLAIVLAVNFLFINRPLASSLGQTSYANVFVYGHYGAFVQPNVIVIHIPRSDKLTADNLAEFFVALAQSTPKNPITNDYFDRVAITSGWTAQYSFPGSAWKSLGDMKGQSAEDIRTQVLSNGSDGSGEPLLGATTLNEAAQEERREAMWKQFVANFTKSGS
jgi:hypothetical protein